ncbi:gliding motility protein GldN [Flavobacterium sp.]|uniref:type IX secretion system ring protein PorN/GldN n=1 Tax=Flavobacterium sp. TaxID=239 RepID=UPI003529BF30
MNWKKIIVVALVSLSSTFTFAQSNLLNAKTADQIGKKTEAELQADNDKPLPYGYVMDRDVMWGRKVWEIIDLDERVNFPLYYPVEKDLGPDRKPLYTVLKDAMEKGEITEVYADSYFTTKITQKEIDGRLYAIDTTDAAIDLMNEDYEAYKSGAKTIPEEYIVKYEVTPDMVTAFKIVGLWYFDKRQGELKYRMLGICPVVPDIHVYKQDPETDEMIELFWVYFPAARDVLHDAKAFNNKNSAIPFSFDHLLNARRFNALIYVEENVYADREIKDYIRDNAQMQLLEADRVKEKIRDFEQDMWSY